jgi:hypothetical protein
MILKRVFHDKLRQLSLALGLSVCLLPSGGLLRSASTTQLVDLQPLKTFSLLASVSGRNLAGRHRERDAPGH